MEKTELEPHYFRTSPDCETREECWQEIAEYLAKNASNRLVFFRDTPEVITERDFDTKRERHAGYVRFNAGQKREPIIPKLPMGFGDVRAKS